jgi:hypothetical protein
MKVFVVYDLDSKMPVAVGEQVTAETARYCASVATGIFHANLFAEEIDLEKNYPHHRSQAPASGKRLTVRDDVRCELGPGLLKDFKCDLTANFFSCLARMANDPAM